MTDNTASKDWQPIETAPKHKPFLAYEPYDGDDWEIGIDLVWFEPAYAGYTIDGNNKTSLAGYTHWMPLPSPPSDAPAPTPLDPETAADNAALIAAIPKMVEALEAARDSLDAPSTRGERRLLEQINAVLASIGRTL